MKEGWPLETDRLEVTGLDVSPSGWVYASLAADVM